MGSANSTKWWYWVTGTKWNRRGVAAQKWRGYGWRGGKISFPLSWGLKVVAVMVEGGREP